MNINTINKLDINISVASNLFCKKKKKIYTYVIKDILKK